MLKNQYTQRLDEKNEMEKLLRKCIEDYKQELWEIKTNLRYSEKQGDEYEQKALKDKIKDILKKEKQLTLLYDKLFYARKHTIKTDSEKFQMS